MKLGRQVRQDDDLPCCFDTPCDICGENVWFFRKSWESMLDVTHEHADFYGGIFHDECKKSLPTDHPARKLRDIDPDIISSFEIFPAIKSSR